MQEIEVLLQQTRDEVRQETNRMDVGDCAASEKRSGSSIRRSDKLFKGRAHGVGGRTSRVRCYPSCGSICARTIPP